MDASLAMMAATAVGVLILVLVGILALVKAFYIKVDQGQALIKNDTTATPKVYFTGGMVLPVIHKKEIMQISVITLEIDRRGKDGLICKDNLRPILTWPFICVLMKPPKTCSKWPRRWALTALPARMR